MARLERLIAFRKSLGLKQGDFSKPLGLTQSAYSQMEVGGSNPTYTTLEKLMEIYKLSVNWLITGKGDMRIDDSDELAYAPLADPNIHEGESLRKYIRNSDYKLKDIIEETKLSKTFWQYRMRRVRIKPQEKEKILKALINLGFDAKHDEVFRFGGNIDIPDFEVLPDEEGLALPPSYDILLEKFNSCEKENELLRQQVKDKQQLIEMWQQMAKGKDN